MIRKPTGTSLDKLKPPAKKADMLEIEKDVPMPLPHSRGSVIKETLLNMVPGDSYVVKHPAASHAQAKKLGMKIVARREGDGFRVWRFK